MTRDNDAAVYSVHDPYQPWQDGETWGMKLVGLAYRKACGQCPAVAVLNAAQAAAEQAGDAAQAGAAHQGRLPKRPRVSFSLYVAAMNKLDQLEAPVLLELLETAEAHGTGLEEFRAQLSSMVGPAVTGSKAQRLRCLAAGWKRAAWKYKRLYYQERARNVILRATNVMPVVSSPMIIIGDDE